MAVIHFSIKVIGTVICLPLYLLITSVLQLDFIHIAVTPWNIAMVHTIYNLAITAILMPFTKYLVKLGKWLVKAKDGNGTLGTPCSTAPDLLLLRSPFGGAAGSVTTIPSDGRDGKRFAGTGDLLSAPTMSRTPRWY